MSKPICYIYLLLSSVVALNHFCLNKYINELTSCLQGSRCCCKVEWFKSLHMLFLGGETVNLIIFDILRCHYKMEMLGAALVNNEEEAVSIGSSYTQESSYELI